MVLFDPHRYAYPSRRSVVYARRAMACTSVPLGAQVGLDVMKAGGNAVDAAVAMAAAMPLLEPTGNGIGGDCFALVWVEREKKLYGLNASGVSPAALSAALVRERGFGEMPKEGWLPTMVPGAPGGWAELNRRFGTRPLEELFAPAASYAREGVAVPVNVAVQWALDGPRIGRAMERDPAPQGNMVSFIQSNYTTFGAGIRIPGTGICLQNRGANFSLDEGSDNCLAGGKKSYHTIIPGFLMKEGTAVGPFGVMGAFMQPQGHVQVVVNTVDYHMNPQECLDAPRMQWTGGKRIQLEREVPAHIGLRLAEMGHQVEICNSNLDMGRGQIIWRMEDGTLAGGTEPRCDGTVAAW